MYDSEIIWACGSAGTVTWSEDGGQNWNSRTIPGLEERELRDVHIASPDRITVMAVDAPAELWSTEDGGSNWRRIYRDDRPGMFLDSFDFWPDGRGLCFGDVVDGIFTILVSDTEGNNWQGLKADSLPTPLPGEAGFAASGTLVRCLPDGLAYIATGGARARILVTQDFGRSFEAHETPMAQGQPSQGTFSLGCSPESADHLILIGGDYQNPEVSLGTAAWSDDGGQSVQCSGGALPGYRSCVQPVPGSAGKTWIAVGKGGASLSYNQGRTWHPLAIKGYTTIAFVPELSGEIATAFLTGPQGAMARLTLRP